MDFFFNSFSVRSRWLIWHFFIVLISRYFSWTRIAQFWFVLWLLIMTPHGANLWHKLWFSSEQLFKFLPLKIQLFFFVKIFINFPHLSKKKLAVGAPVNCKILLTNALRHEFLVFLEGMIKFDTRWRCEAWFENCSIMFDNFSVSSSVSNDNSHFGSKNGATMHTAVKW